MKKYLLVFFLVIISVSAQSIKWTNIENAFKKATSLKKVVMVFFYTDRCEICKEVEKTTFSEKDVINYLNKHYICAKVNPEKNGGRFKVKGSEYTYKSFAHTSGVVTCPAYGFYYSSGYLIKELQGYSGPGNFLSSLKFIADNVKKEK